MSTITFLYTERKGGLATKTRDLTISTCNHNENTDYFFHVNFHYSCTYSTYGPFSTLFIFMSLGCNGPGVDEKCVEGAGKYIRQCLPWQKASNPQGSIPKIRLRRPGPTPNLIFVFDVHPYT